jgi:hypothetical protein
MSWKHVPSGRFGYSPCVNLRSLTVYSRANRFCQDALTSKLLRRSVTVLALQCTTLAACDRPSSNDTGVAASAPIDSGGRLLLFNDTSPPYEARPRVPVPAGSDVYVIPNACPGEYCALGQWTLSEPLRLRAAPSTEADPVAYVPARHPICADSGIIVVDPPGLVVIGDTVSLTYNSEEPRFSIGDTVIVYNYESEGYYQIRWRDSLISAYAHWNDYDKRNAKILRRARNLWWVHVTDQRSGGKGWILRLATSPQPQPNSWGFDVVDGGEPVGPRELACAREG